VFVFIGAFAANFSAYDLVALFVFSLLGFMMRRHGWPRPPLLLGVVLGNKMERYLWLSYARFGLSWLLRPAVIALFGLVIASFLLPYIKERRQRRQKAAISVKPV
jgi:TctA family transporter